MPKSFSNCLCLPFFQIHNIVIAYHGYISRFLCFLHTSLCESGLRKQKVLYLHVRNKSLRSINVSNTSRLTFSLRHLHSAKTAELLSCSPIMSISICTFFLGSFPHQRPSDVNSIGIFPSISSFHRYCVQIRHCIFMYNTKI